MGEKSRCFLYCSTTNVFCLTLQPPPNACTPLPCSFIVAILIRCLHNLIKITHIIDWPLTLGFYTNITKILIRITILTLNIYSKKSRVSTHLHAWFIPNWGLICSHTHLSLICVFSFFLSFFLFEFRTMTSICMCEWQLQNILELSFDFNSAPISGLHIGEEGHLLLVW
jgi:hypothetical protein